VATEPLNPRVQPLFGGRYAENTSGIIAAINACIDAAGGTVTTYPSNTAGIIQALIDLEAAISGTSGNSSVVPTTSGEALSEGDVVYVKASDGKIYKATNAATFERANVLGMVKEAVSAADQPVKIVVRGPCGGYTGLTIGSEYFLGLDGAITTTAPSGGGLYSVQVGTAVSATKLDVHPVTPALTT
jgi:hypothetical protein